MVDEAHGALFKFHPVLPTSAVEAGADLVTQSTHKTTEALSQGSVILVGNPDLREAVLDAINSVPAISTSFSYPILASVEEAVANLDEFGWRRIEYALDLAECFRAEIQPLAPAYRTWGAEQAGGPGFKELNPLCVTVDVKGTGLTGFEVNKLLQSDEKGSLRVVAEMADLQNVLFLVSYGNKRSDIDADNRAPQAHRRQAWQAGLAGAAAFAPASRLAAAGYAAGRCDVGIPSQQQGQHHRL